MKVEFHSGVGDKLGTACRFLRRAQDAGASVVVCADPATLDRLDQALWTFEPLSFVAHLRLRPGVAVREAVAARTRIRLAETPGDAAPGVVLMNLGPEIAEPWQRFDRVVEIVSQDSEDAAAGRRRWRHYSQHPGIELVHHTRAGAA